MRLTRIRKDQHLDVCADSDVEAEDRQAGFSEVALMPRTLPELAWEDIDTRVGVFGREFGAPFLIAGMTFGFPRAEQINSNLARCAAHFNIPMGVGSQRIALEGGGHRQDFVFREEAPNIFLLANIGISHLERDLCLQAVEMITADALAIHLNVMQELIQPEGSRDFRHIFTRLEKVAVDFPVPIIAKEVGFGIDMVTAERLFAAGAAAVDVGGKGGTSWSWIEGLRATDLETRELAASFRNWGIPTAFNTAAMRAAFPHKTIIATGGIRSGLTAAKALALGANLVGVGLPLLKAAMVSAEQTIKTMHTFIRGLKIAMLATGNAKISTLSQSLCAKPSFSAGGLPLGKT